MSNWTVKLGNVGFLRLSDWSVEWVEIKTDAPTITFRCNLNALLNPKLADAYAEKRGSYFWIGGNCHIKGKSL